MVMVKTRSEDIRLHPLLKIMEIFSVTFSAPKNAHHAARETLLLSNIQVPALAVLLSCPTRLCPLVHFKSKNVQMVTQALRLIDVPNGLCPCVSADGGCPIPLLVWPTATL